MMRYPNPYFTSGGDITKFVSDPILIPFAMIVEIRSVGFAILSSPLASLNPAIIMSLLNIYVLMARILITS
ncbi:MAG: hypothetical protein AAB090_04495 [Nitrospirota bacterium]